MPTEITVVVPVYNRAQTVLETLDSVAGQNSAPTGLIVVDDGSTDNSADDVQAWLRAHASVSQSLLIRSKNRGAGAARNLGLQHVTTPWVAFLDSDDLWPADFLARAQQVLASSSELVAATADRRYIDTSGSTISLSSTKGIAANAIQWLFENDGGIASASVMRTDVVRRLGGFSEVLPTGEDSILFHPLSLAGPWRHIPGEPVTYRVGIAASRGEFGNLTSVVSGNHRRWAQIYDDFIMRHGGSKLLPRSVYSRVLARRWFVAGKYSCREEACYCLLRSLSWRFKTQTLWKLARIYLGQRTASSKSSAA
ncbi:MAG: glycosyltransferase family A protein [Pirellulaceae bacterium]|nr:glycosyltransferase family A protein [Pirellulaceae bacterium]